MKRVRVEVCPQRGAFPWKVTVDSVSKSHESTQADGIWRARKLIADLVKMGRTVTLKIKRPNGEIRDERTYPRSSDPRRTRG